MPRSEASLEQRRQYVRDWRERHPEYGPEYRRRRREEQPEKYEEGLAYVRQWRRDNPGYEAPGHDAAMAAWKAKNPEYFTNWNRKHLYGLTPEDYYDLLEAQNYRCAICDEPSDRLCVDHCHETDQIRGLLCIRCNSMLGFARDNTERLMRAADYLNHVREEADREIDSLG
jgi:Recombination endonuclease VII